MSETRLDLAKRIVRRAGALLFQGLGCREGLEKTPGHVVSPVDLDVDAYIVGEVQRALPQDSVLTEESGLLRGTNDYLWVVDPVDGTSNLRLGIPYVSSAIAVVRRGEPILAAVFNPFSDEMFTAERGSGAFLNGQRLHVSSRSQSPVGFYQQGYGVSMDVQSELLGSLSAISRRVLQMWCPSLDWCNIAAGRVEYLVAYETEVEDFVQGRLILEEAGGRVTSWAGGSPDLTFISGERATVVASNGVVHDDVRRSLPGYNGV